MTATSQPVQTGRPVLRDVRGAMVLAAYLEYGILRGVVPRAWDLAVIALCLLVAAAAGRTHVRVPCGSHVNRVYALITWPRATAACLVVAAAAGGAMALLPLFNVDTAFVEPIGNTTVLTVFVMAPVARLLSLHLLAAAATRSSRKPSRP
jgi:hypothetical protein